MVAPSTGSEWPRPTDSMQIPTHTHGSARLLCIPLLRRLARRVPARHHLIPTCAISSHLIRSLVTLTHARVTSPPARHRPGYASLGQRESPENGSYTSQHVSAGPREITCRTPGATRALWWEADDPPFEEHVVPPLVNIQCGACGRSRSPAERIGDWRISDCESSMAASSRCSQGAAAMGWVTKMGTPSTLCSMLCEMVLRDSQCHSREPRTGCAGRETVPRDGVCSIGKPVGSDQQAKGCRTSGQSW